MSTKQSKSTSRKAGRVAAKATMGTLFGIGRFVGRTSVGFAEGVAEAASEIKRGYDKEVAAKK